MTTRDDFWGRAYRGRIDHLWRWSDGTEYVTLCGLWRRTREVWKHGLNRCRKCERLATTTSEQDG